LIPTGVVSNDEVGLQEIPTASIRPNPQQPREHFDEESLAALAESIREVGVLQPVLVRAGGDGFELIAGERRWRAARRIGLQTIPAIVRTADDASMLQQAIIENVQREELNPLEEAAAYQQLIEDFQLTHDQVAVRVGKSRAAISNTLRLFQLPPSIQKLVAEGQLSAGHARGLLGTPDRAFQEQLARRAVADGLSVREVEDAVRQRNELSAATASNAGAELGGASAAGPRRLRAPGLLELEELFSQHLDTRVQVTMGAKRGKVVIEFAGLEDLERLYRVIAAGQS
ncbi:MAG: ParB family transcriptional regulator, chromosome partitioning protein, partial [Acidimicrobiaceae bacterium]